ncbi:MAG: hypothetical protein QME55_07230 [Brevundimonas sp.]|uniref:hypothetical protein n=1 Tax=Brevundimonas sp. TaxID=1871086 RepID=UPI002618090F|nr:hypothetical protein [Brevundimonas sp.]MDI6624505.1 hypothetical protein [Brevundimonas sp.]MDQ7813121.1 hypothetical protein [Brevundimonas sp.]
MLDAETRKLIETAKARRQIELSARFVDAAPPPGRPDPRAGAVREQAWADLKDQIVAAVGDYEGDGLRVLRHLKTRPEIILTGPVATWRRFLDEKRALVAAPTVEFRHYIKHWSHGLPGFPE